MISAGETLYRIWADAMMHEGISVDEWDDLGEKEQAAWTVAAEDYRHA